MLVLPRRRAAHAIRPTMTWIDSIAQPKVVSAAQAPRRSSAAGDEGNLDISEFSSEHGKTC